jgi:chaperonin GroES
MSKKKINIRPLYDCIIVKRAEEEKVKGSIIIPDTAKEKPLEGTIVAAGNGRLLDDGKVLALQVKRGDKILFGRYSGTEIKLDGEEFLMMRESEVFGIIEGKK